MEKFALSCLLIVCLLTAPGRSSAEEPEWDYWFTETITIAAVEMPPGVSLRTSDLSTGPRAYILLENSTETLLYVLALTYKDNLVMSTPDPLWKTRLNYAHEVASFYAAPDHPVYLPMQALADLDHNLVDHNQPSTDSPPVDVSIPASQTSELLLVYDGLVILVPFTITYALNPLFQNQAQASQLPAPTLPATQPKPAATSQARQNQQNVLLAAGILLAIGLVVAGWLVWQGSSRR